MANISTGLAVGSAEGLEELTSMSACSIGSWAGEEDLRSLFSAGPGGVPLGETAGCGLGGEGGGVGSRTKG